MRAFIAVVALTQQIRLAPGDMFVIGSITQVRAKLALQEQSGEKGDAENVSLGLTAALKRHIHAFPAPAACVLLVKATLIAIPAIMEPRMMALPATWDLSQHQPVLLHGHR
jgi:hypothetical protein